MRKVYLKLSFVIFFASMGSIISGVRSRYYCTDEDRQSCSEEIKPVCGWFDVNTPCATKPCVIDADNRCKACSIPGVQYVTQGD
jgi:hypothetical protein